MKIGVVLPQTEIGNDRGVTHLCVHTANMGLAKPADHVEMLRRFRQTVGLK